MTEWAIEKTKYRFREIPIGEMREYRGVQKAKIYQALRYEMDAHGGKYEFRILREACIGVWRIE